MKKTKSRLLQAAKIGLSVLVTVLVVTGAVSASIAWPAPPNGEPAGGRFGALFRSAFPDSASGIWNTGIAGIMGTSTGSRLNVVGLSNDSTTNSLQVQNASGATLFYVRGDGATSAASLTTNAFTGLGAMGVGGTGSGKLTVIGTGTGTSTFGMIVSNIASAFNFVVRDDGNVGIGIATPTAKLDVNGEINLNNNRITNVAVPTSTGDVATKGYVDAAAGGGGIKLVQRGTFSSSGTATITAVNTSKAYIISVSKGSAGTVAATGNISLSPSGSVANSNGGSSPNSSISAVTYNGGITGGTTDLTVKEYSAVLTNATTVTADGPCEWQVIEFN